MLAGGCPAAGRLPPSRTGIEASTPLPRLREKVRRSEDRDTGNHVGIGVGAAPCRDVTSDTARVAISLMARRSLSAWLKAAFPIVAQLEGYRSELGSAEGQGSIARRYQAMASSYLLVKHSTYPDEK